MNFFHFKQIQYLTRCIWHGATLVMNMWNFRKKFFQSSSPIRDQNLNWLKRILMVEIVLMLAWFSMYNIAQLSMFSCSKSILINDRHDKKSFLYPINFCIHPVAQWLCARLPTRVARVRSYSYTVLLKSRGLDLRFEIFSCLWQSLSRTRASYP